MIGRIQFSENNGHYILRATGEIRLILGYNLECFFSKIFIDLNFQSIIIDLSKVTSIDSTMLGSLVRLAIRSKKTHNHTPTLISTNDNITRILWSMSCDSVFNIIKKITSYKNINFYDIPYKDHSEFITHEQVLTAHKALTSLNDKNKQSFHQLIDQLEKQKK